MRRAVRHRLQVAPRHDYRPPLCCASPATRAEDLATAGCPLPLTDIRGERLIDGVRIALGWDAGHLYLYARVVDADCVIDADRPVEHPRFWMQDHIEFRVVPDPAWDGDQVQVLATAGGRIALNGAFGPGEATSAVTRTDDGWTLALRVPVGLLGRSALHAGDELRCLAARVRWGDGCPDIAASGAVVLGFPQAERFPRVRLDEAVAPVRLTGGDAALAPGENRLRIEAGGDAAAIEVEQDGAPVAMASDGSFSVELTRPRYGEVCWYRRDADGGRTRVGSICLRSAVAEPTIGARAHPYLMGDAETWQRRRALLDEEPYRTLDAARARSDLDALRAELPDPAVADDFRFAAHDGNWLRISRETLLRDGATGRQATAQLIWDRLDPAAQECARVVAEDLQADPGPLLAAFDALLDRDDLYRDDLHAEASLPPVVRRLRAAHGGLPPAGRDRRMHNRAFLQGVIGCLGAYRGDLLRCALDLAEDWVCTQNPDALRLATDYLAAAAERTILEEQMHLHTGMLAERLGRAYDLVASQLDADARRIWLEWAATLLELYRDTAHGASWTVTTTANANPVGNGGAGILALATWHELPELARPALRTVRDNLWNWIDYCHGPDGGNTEGAQYWQYGMEHFLAYAHAFETVTGDDDTMFDQPAVRHCMAMIEVGLCNDGKMHGVNDTIPMPIGGGMAWFAGSRFGDELGAWYGDHVVRAGAERRAAGKKLAYLPSLWHAWAYRPPGPMRTAAPPLPRCRVLEHSAVGILRSEPRWDCRMDLGIKGSRPPYTHHNQTDTGALFCDRDGERLLIDPGYYRGDADCHCLPLIDGVGPTVGGAWVGALTGSGTGDGWSWIALDSSLAYQAVAARCARCLVLCGPDLAVVIDDIATDAPVCLQWQCGGPASERPGGVLVTGQATELALAFPVVDGAAVELAAERSFHPAWGYHFAECRWFPVHWRSGAPTAPLVTLVGAPAAVDAAECRVAEAAVTITTPAGAELRFARGAEGWGPVPSSG